LRKDGPCRLVVIIDEQAVLDSLRGLGEESLASRFELLLDLVMEERVKE
jgi:hypothetical protein